MEAGFLCSMDSSTRSQASKRLSLNASRKLRRSASVAERDVRWVQLGIMFHFDGRVKDAS
jgi:hypothetical protein